jgi:GTP-binding protein
MIVKHAELAAVAVRKNQYPLDDRVEIAFAGRSNVGKSSLLNLLTGRKALAKVSGSPGKTRTINFYDVNGTFRIVDLPGYGYAKASKSATAGWGDMIETCLKSRRHLARVALLADIRHRPTVQDVQMYDWIRYYGLDGLVVATKADKVSKSEAAKSLQVIREVLGLDAEAKIFPVSALKRTGVEELLSEIGRLVGEEEPCNS